MVKHRSGTQWLDGREVRWCCVQSTPCTRRRGKRISWFGLKTKVDDLLVVWPQNHWDEFLGLCLKIGSYDLVLLASKSLRQFLGLGLKTKRAMVCRLCHKIDGRTSEPISKFFISIIIWGREDSDLRDCIWIMFRFMEQSFFIFVVVSQLILLGSFTRSESWIFFWFWSGLLVSSWVRFLNSSCYCSKTYFFLWFLLLPKATSVPARRIPCTCCRFGSWISCPPQIHFCGSSRARIFIYRLPRSPLPTWFGRGLCLRCKLLQSMPHFHFARFGVCPPNFPGHRFPVSSPCGDLLMWRPSPAPSSRWSWFFCSISWFAKFLVRLEISRTRCRHRIVFPSQGFFFPVVGIAPSSFTDSRSGSRSLILFALAQGLLDLLTVSPLSGHRVKTLPLLLVRSWFVLRGMQHLLVDSACC
jgi:hypothetical protein